MTRLRSTPVRLLAALAATATVLTAAACTSHDSAIRPDGSVDLSKVTLRVGDQKGTATQAMLESAGELRSVPYHLSWAQFTSGPPMLEAVNAGAVDVGTVGDAPPVFAAAAGSKIRIVGSYNDGVAGQAIVVPKDSSITSPAQLRGKKIAVAKGTSAHYHLLKVLARNGLRLSDVQPQYLQPADALAAISGGRADAWAIWDPYTAQAQDQIGARVLVDGTGYVKNDSFVVTRPDALGDKALTAALGDFLARLRRAHAWANAHASEWAAVFARLTGLPRQVALTDAERGPITDFPIAADVVAGEQDVVDTFAAAHVIAHTFAIGDFIDTRFDKQGPTSPRPPA
jgi:sulfonate transport system substrate-binding protein